VISGNEVKNIANLARIHLQEDETRNLTKDLEKILCYIEKLAELDISDIQPTSHVLSMKNAFREDNIIKPLAQKDALQFCVEQKDGAFKVPKIIE